jgi:archaetidylinositol phosphate synthase
VSKDTDFHPAARANTSVLAALEKRTLIWIAQRLPAWVNSDHLTVLGFVSLIATGALYWYARNNPLALLAAIAALSINWFGDSLDGTLARVRNRQRPRYGFYVDHVLDAVGTFFLMSGLAFSGYMSPPVAYAFLIAYLLLSIEIYLATYTIGTFHLSYWNFGPTELRILLAVGSVVALWRPTALIAGREFLLFDVGFAIGSAALAVILAQAVIQHTRALYKLETNS